MNAAVKVATADSRRTDRILEAAAKLYVTYGARRTSMDDIASEAGMAKGSLYLSFKSKDDLFQAVILSVLQKWIDSGRERCEAESNTLEKLVGYLDATVGEPARLLKSTAHAADLLEAKGRLASELLSGYRHQVREEVSALLKDHPDLPRMVIEAAYGCLETGDMASHAYGQRLRQHIAALISTVA